MEVRACLHDSNYLSFFVDSVGNPSGGGQPRIKIEPSSPSQVVQSSPKRKPQLPVLVSVVQNRANGGHRSPCCCTGGCMAWRVTRLKATTANFKTSFTGFILGSP